MTANKLANIRNIGMIAHIDAGKTTTTERMLFYSGRTHQWGDVDDGTTVTDWWEQERERGITLKAAAITTNWRDSVTGEDAQINIIDTPGHIDFTAEVQRSLRVLDGGVVIFDAVNGVEPQSETVWRQANAFHLPRICYINKMDRPNADYAKTVEMIRVRFQAEPVLVQLPIGGEESFTGIIDLLTMKAIFFAERLGDDPQIVSIPDELTVAAQRAHDRMVERIAETDEELALQYLAGEEIGGDDLIRVLRRAVIANQLTPVLFGTSLHNKGVQPLLDAIIRYLPSPVDLPPINGIEPVSGALVQRTADISAPLAALVFKIVIDPFAGRLAYARLYSGRIRQGQTLYNANRNKSERVHRLFQIQADKRTEITECHAGDIVAIAGFKETTTGETLCDEQKPILLESISFPEPVIWMAVEAQSAADQEKLTEAFMRLDEEDPTLRYAIDEQTGQATISGMGELHLEVAIERLRRDYGVQCRVGPPQVAYRETVSKAAEAEETYERAFNGRQQVARLKLLIAPDEPNAGFTVSNRVGGNRLSEQDAATIHTTVKSILQSGYLVGYPFVGVKVTIVDAERQANGSTTEDFAIAITIAMRELLRRAQPIVLEPIMRVESYVPEEYLGTIVNDFGSRHGLVQQMNVSGDGTRTITVLAPLTEMLGYATKLQSMTSGHGTFTMELDHYTQASDAIHERFLGPEWRERFYAE